jgi:hypothetical protein
MDGYTVAIFQFFRESFDPSLRMKLMATIHLGAKPRDATDATDATMDARDATAE